MPKVGDVVVFTVQDRAHNALVLHVNENLPDHFGKHGEPMLHLAFLAPERESDITKKKFAYLPEIFLEYDVVHVSQEFSEEYKRDHGLSTPAQIATHRGAGTWQEVPQEVAADPTPLVVPPTKARQIKGK